MLGYHEQTFKQERLKIISEFFPLPQSLVDDILTKYLRCATDDFAVDAVHKHWRPMGIVPDAEYGFILKFKGETLAGIWFDILSFKRCIYIKQIQTARLPNSEESKVLRTIIRSFRWERMLVRLAVEWARFYAFREVRVVRAENQKYWHEGIESRCSQFRMRYNVTAQREGFEGGEEYSKLILA